MAERTLPSPSGKTMTTPAPKVDSGGGGAAAADPKGQVFGVVGPRLVERVGAVDLGSSVFTVTGAVDT